MSDCQHDWEVIEEASSMLLAVEMTGRDPQEVALMGPFTCDLHVRVCLTCGEIDDTISSAKRRMAQNIEDNKKRRAEKESRQKKANAMYEQAMGGVR
jgi:hypothetical protein